MSNCTAAASRLPAAWRRWWTGAGGVKPSSTSMRPTAVRILDFAHAAERITAIGELVGPARPLLSSDDRTRLLHALKHPGPDGVLAELRALREAHPALEEVATHVDYLEQRVAQLQYPVFAAAGWPLGSGSVESANKLVVEDRLKGRACIGRMPTSTRCWRCGMRYVTTAGKRVGRARGGAAAAGHGASPRHAPPAPGPAPLPVDCCAARAAPPLSGRTHRPGSGGQRRTIRGVGHGACGSSGGRQADLNLQECVSHPAT